MIPTYLRTRRCLAWVLLSQTMLVLSCASDPPTTPRVDAGGGAMDVPMSRCVSAQECDQREETRGQICIASRCVTCSSDMECATASRYGAGATCDAQGRCARVSCEAGTVGCACLGSGRCTSGVCDATTQRCRAARTCVMAGCAERQVCQPGPGGDAECQSGCEPGYSWNAAMRRCDVIAGLNCRMGDAMSIAAMCEAQERRCVEAGSSAMCGGCVEGRVLEGGTCRAARTCMDLGCAAQQRECRAATGGSDAECLGCLPGYTMGDGGNCVVVAGPVTCESLGCAGQNRVCGADGGLATCGACRAGFMEDVGGRCVPVPMCPLEMCTRGNRACVMEGGAARCGACLDGFLEEGGVCRARRTCATINCTGGQRCDDSDPTMDARCVGMMACAGGQIRDRFSNTCVDCPLACAGGAARRGLTGLPYSDTLFVGEGMPGRCLCATEPGYYLEEGGSGGAFPCDADGDGWVQANARAVVEIPETDMGRAPLRANARCRVRQMTAVDLVSEGGSRLRDTLTAAVALYEARRNDDQGQLELESGAVPVIGSGTGARALRAEEVNSLTKACVSVSADHNANFLEDVRESDTSTLRAGTGGDTIPMSLLSTYQVFLRYGYFVELYRGSFAAADAATDMLPTTGSRLVPGVYTIRERSRLATAMDRVGPTYAAGADPYWQQCIRRRDAEFSNDATIGMDLARYTGTDFAGMLHHSQFRCVQWVDNATIVGATDRHMLRLGATTAPNAPWVLNSCRLASEPAAPSAAPNPSEPRVNCTTEGATEAAGRVTWVASTFRDYTTPNGYVRGCINECAEQNRIAAERRCTASMGQCLVQSTRFGQVQCCAAGQTACGGRCVDMQSDVAHCGACGRACGAGQSCCAGTCVNLQTDRGNCGTCGRSCPTGEVCSMGACCLAGMVRIPAGSFVMGAPADKSGTYSWEGPQRTVTLSAYCLGVTEVTVADYRRCVTAGSCSAPNTRGRCNWNVSGREAHPINCIDWNQAGAVCAFLYPGRGRLPTEAEWENAASVGGTRRHPWGDTPPSTQLCWFGGDWERADLGTCAVGSFPSGNTPSGIQDLSGNVREWTSDWFGRYPSNNEVNPTGPTSGSGRVIRGGSWYDDVWQFEYTRARFRSALMPEAKLDEVGVRCAAGLP
jgi:sulfatase modifying factor 1